MSLEQGFLRDICENPDDDAPRLVYADWLEERGGKGDAERATLIRTQIELTRPGLDSNRASQLKEQETQLLETWAKTWVKPFRPHFSRYEFRRGFIERATIQTRAFVEHADSLLALTPLRRAKLRDPKDHVAALAACAALERIDALSLNFGKLGVARTRTFLSSPHLGKLRVLDLGNNGLGRSGLEAILNAAPRLAGLRVLCLDDNHVKDTAIVELSTDPFLGQLTKLNLERNSLTPIALQALAASPYATGLTEIALCDNGLGQAGIEVLLTSPHLQGLRKLYANGCGISIHVQQALRRRFGHRVELSFTYTQTLAESAP